MTQNKKSVSQTPKTTVDTEEVAVVEIDFDGGSQSQNTPKGQ